MTEKFTFTSSLFDSSSLLSHVHQQQEQTDEEAAHFFGGTEQVEHFGHPPPPDLSLLSLREFHSSDSNHDGSNAAVLMVANTKECVSAQVLFPTEKSHNHQTRDPVEVCKLFSLNYDNKDLVEKHQRDYISCLKLLVLEDPEVIANSNKEGDVVSFDCENEEDFLKKPKISAVKRRASFQRVAVVLGTSLGRVLSVELGINPSTSAIVRISPLILKAGIQDREKVFFEPLPLDADSLKRSGRSMGRKSNGFSPTGGVSSLAAYCIGDMKKVTQLWITYGDGTIIRLHHAAFFPSVMHADNEQKQGMLSSLGINESLMKCQVQLDEVKDGEVVPIPKYHPSPMAPLAPLKLLNDDDIASFPDPLLNDEREDDGEEDSESPPEFQEAFFYASNARLTDGFPTFAFFTSEDQFVRNTTITMDKNNSPSTPSASEGSVLGSVLGGTASVVSGVVGVAFGAFFGYGETSTNKQIENGAVEKKDDDDDDENDDTPVAKQYFPEMYRSPIKLFAGFELHDAPRQVESCTIDPDGDLAATTDGLGRVLLIDLASKQIIRMWKGFRESTCCWLQIARPTVDNPDKKFLFLVINSRQRRVVEVWHVRHGPRVKSLQVGRDAHLVPCIEWSKCGYLSTCYLAHSRTPGATSNHLEKITVEEDAVIKTTGALLSMTPGTVRRNIGSAKSTSMKEAALRLQRLQQLLANTNVPCKAKDIENALSEITSLKDLATALDRLSVATVLEMKMEVRGADFHKVALKYCRQKLAEAVKQAKDKDPSNNPNVMLLANKILYHSQVVNAYEVLHKFETGSSETNHQKGPPQSPWVAEAVGWIATYETVNSTKLDAEVTSNTEPLKFATFANACEGSVAAKPLPVKIDKHQKQHRLQIYFSDSSKTRRDVLVHIFMPLLRDVFAFNVVNSIFDSLGIKDDSEYLLKCFGEWFMTLPAKEASEKGLFAQHSPMMRWLQELAILQFEKHSFDEHGIILRTLHDFCEKSSDLVRSFLLCTLCREAVTNAAAQKEQKTYGKISRAVAVKCWDRLLRKLRVCLLVSLRLNCFRNGAFSITVHNVDQADFFSVYEWLAHDELAMSQKHEEILTLEKACNVSGFVFDPSTEAGDDPSHFRMLQNSCISASISDEERVEYLVDLEDDDKLGALLLYLNHYNEPRLLVAHRAILLASKWSSKPSDLRTLADALVALQNLCTTPGFESLAFAVRLEVWQTQIRPVFRAYLYGFDDVQELSENVVAPLFKKPAWMQKFSRIALEVLNLLLQTEWNDSMNIFEPPLETNRDSESWPPVRVDFILKRLVERSRWIHKVALDAHLIIVCAIVVSKEIQSVYNCIPSIHECFESVSLFNPVSPTEISSEVQLAFVEDAIIARAQTYSGPPLENLSLGEIDILVDMWGLDRKVVRTLFFLAMYEFGKDRIVDKLLTKSTAYIDVPRLVQDGVDIACRRLNDLIHMKRSQPQALRDAIGLLDADMCEWIRERSIQSVPLVVFSNLQVPIGNTHLLALRLLGLSRGANDDPAKRVKIHSLIVLSGTLVKAMENGQSAQKK